MKQKHLYSLLDTSYITVGVVFAGDDSRAAPPPPQLKQGRDGRIAERDRTPPWGQPNPGYVGKAYTYKVPKDAGVQVDDYVVVYSDSRGLLIARVVRVDEVPQIDVDASFDYKWVVQKVDREGYQARVQAERAFADAMMEIERVKQREQMINGFRDNLPADSEARRLFDRTVASLGSPTVDHEPPAVPQG